MPINHDGKRATCPYSATSTGTFTSNLRFFSGSMTGSPAIITTANMTGFYPLNARRLDITLLVDDGSGIAFPGYVVNLGGSVPITANDAFTYTHVSHGADATIPVDVTYVGASFPFYVATAAGGNAPAGTVAQMRVIGWEY
jgi:hypothetical protein